MTRDQSTQTDALARHGRDQVLRVSQTIAGLATSIERCTQHMQKLEGHSQEISGVVRVIRDIAEQTVMQTVQSAATSEQLATLAHQLNAAVGRLKT